MILHTEPITDASVWTGEDLRRDRSWSFGLSNRQQDDLANALALVKDHNLSLAEITRAEFPLPSLQPMLQRILHELREGRGFALLRSIPCAGYPLAEIEKLYWGLCTHLGSGVTQNSEAGLVHCVTDGTLRPQQGTRGVGSPGPVGLHIDLADCVALLCIRQAPEDPQSIVASTMTVYNEILAHHPEWLPRLYAGFIWTRTASRDRGKRRFLISRYRASAPAAEK